MRKTKQDLPYGLMCRRHPNYKAMREPHVRGGCSVCELMWQMMRKDRKKDGPDNGSTGGSVRGTVDAIAEGGSLHTVEGPSGEGTVGPV
jgi:hypothetical protein